jgi:hypothetical protein
MRGAAAPGWRQRWRQRRQLASVQAPTPSIDPWHDLAGMEMSFELRPRGRRAHWGAARGGVSSGGGGAALHAACCPALTASHSRDAATAAELRRCTAYREHDPESDGYCWVECSSWWLLHPRTVPRSAAHPTSAPQAAHTLAVALLVHHVGLIDTNLNCGNSGVCLNVHAALCCRHLCRRPSATVVLLGCTEGEECLPPYTQLTVACVARHCS